MIATTIMATVAIIVTVTITSTAAMIGMTTGMAWFTDATPFAISTADVIATIGTHTNTYCPG